MSRVEDVGNFDGQRENQFRFQRTPADAVLQRRSIEMFHGDEVLAVALVNLEDHADVGMVQGRRRLRLALEAGKRLHVFGYIVRQELQTTKR
jgi:hypothetical protein